MLACACVRAAQVECAVCALRTGLMTTVCVELLVFLVGCISSGSEALGGANRLVWLHLPHLFRAYLAAGVAGAVPMFDLSGGQRATSAYAASLGDLWRPVAFLLAWTAACALLDVVAFFILVFGSSASAFGLVVCVVLLGVDFWVPAYALSLRYRLPPVMVVAVWNVGRALLSAPLRARDGPPRHAVMGDEAARAV